MAYVITSDREAIKITQELAHEFAKEAAERDRQSRLPYAELEKLSESGLFGIKVPKKYGGAFVSNVTLAEVIALLSEGDSSIGQIPQNHLYMVETLRLSGTEEQKHHFFKLEHDYEDPLLIYSIGESEIQLHAAEALLRRAGEFIDRAIAKETESSAVEASIAVAEAKVLAGAMPLPYPPRSCALEIFRSWELLLERDQSSSSRRILTL